MVKYKNLLLVLWAVLVWFFEQYWGNIFCDLFNKIFGVSDMMSHISQYLFPLIMSSIIVFFLWQYVKSIVKEQENTISSSAPKEIQDKQLTPSEEVKSFIEKKFQQATALSQNSQITYQDIKSWKEELEEGIRIAHGGEIPSGDITDSMRVIISRVLSADQYPTIFDAKKIMEDCAAQLPLISAAIKPYLLSPNFNPNDLKGCE